jgi:hypothetical protein
MAQLTIRATDELADRVRMAARTSGRSVNSYVVGVLDAATDPDLTGDEAGRLRARLEQAGLLVHLPRRRGSRPDRRAVDAAGRRAARGTPLSEIVVRER